ncbi:hypothetical protein [Myroides sp. ZB35]|uniref:hypothetical protein n=1 Tax=Myroides sp. ZB35 TaxID=1458492 RepID=UPI0008F467C9|nr:hypothetical protein [Myroides sp. ZB35]APA92856.1 hypothetical protein BK054_11650 [Myroides sp. ZB35]
MKKYICNNSKDGLFNLLADALTKVLNLFNFVEFFKLFVVFIYCRRKKSTCDEEKKRYVSRIAIDIFIFLKWILLIVLILKEYESCFTTKIIWYLLFFNLYTYFYYHIWKSENVIEFKSIERTRGRFINLISSIIFSNFCFAYLYKYCYTESFQWGEKGDLGISNSLWFSFANSLTVDYDLIVPKNELGHNLVTLQVIVSFIFLTMILGNSIPKSN